MKNPTWGITGATYLRVLQPMYEDGKFLHFTLLLNTEGSIKLRFADSRANPIRC